MTSTSAATRPGRDAARDPHDRGFILVTVLWIAGLLAVMTAGLSVSVRTHVRVASNLLESAKAEALADAGVALAAMDLVGERGSRERGRRFPSGGQPVVCSILGQGSLSVSVTDEAAKIDVNTAGIPLMRALLAGLGETNEKAAQVAEAIFDYRDADDDRQPNGAESTEYRAAGLTWLPKNGPLQSLDELGQVYGMTPGLLARMRPYLSVHSGLPGLDVSLARPELIALLRAGLERGGGSIGGLPEFDDAVALPAIFASASPRRVFGLRIEARSDTGAVYVREAVIDIGSPQSPERVFLRWVRGPSGTSAASGVSGDGTAPAC